MAERGQPGSKKKLNVTERQKFQIRGIRPPANQQQLPYARRKTDPTPPFRCEVKATYIVRHPDVRELRYRTCLAMPPNVQSTASDDDDA